MEYFFVLLSALISSIISYKAGKYVPLPYYPSTERRGFCTSCIDMRFVNTENEAFESEFGVNGFDIFVAPGPSLALASNSTGLYAPAFSAAWHRGLEISQAVNSTTVVVIADHEDCGYYASAPYVSASSYSAGNYEQRKAIQFRQMSVTLNYLAASYTDTEFEGMWIGLDGSVEYVPF